MSGAKDKSHAHSGPQSRKVENFSVSFNQVSNHIPVDKLVKQYHNELIEVMLHWMHENFHRSQTPILPQMDAVMHLV